VDWSAANQPRIGRDSIWVCELGPAGERLDNPPTRCAAKAMLRDRLETALRAGGRTLLGFDFPFGYPAGFAARLGLSGQPWRAVWDEIAALLADDAQNRNNRFEVAETFNRRASGGRFPFWGCPAGAQRACLGPRHHRRHLGSGLAERRLIDERMVGAQPCWKLLGAGSVGGQALTGIPVVRALRDDPCWRETARVWPFETGLRPPDEARIVFAEVYPSLWPVTPGPGEPKDAAQVREVARFFAARDRAGELAGLFGGDPSLSAEQRRRVETEEAWTLGVIGAHRRQRAAPPSPPIATVSRRPRPGGSGADRPDYLRDPAEIYRRSFATVRAEADLTRFPASLRPLALRLAHAAGDVGILPDLAWSHGAVAAGRKALAAGGAVLVDSTMVAAGIQRERLPADNAIVCTLRDPEVPQRARALRTTRSAAAVELWRPHLAGGVVAIGNAPTALFRLLELLEAGAPPPALILGFPVGFVGAAEAKAALARSRSVAPYIVLHGRRGGSALAAAAVNALIAGGGR